MSQPVVTVATDAPMEDVIATMERHRIRRVPVVDEQGACAGIIAQADVAWTERLSEVGELVREVSRE
jgi:CBS domain-containing protein